MKPTIDAASSNLRRSNLMFDIETRMTTFLAQKWISADPEVLRRIEMERMSIRKERLEDTSDSNAA